MCQTNEKNQNQAPSCRKLPDFSEFDPAKVDISEVQVVEMTADVLAGKRTFLGVTGANAVQIIGGVRPPTIKTEKSKDNRA